MAQVYSLGGPGIVFDPSRAIRQRVEADEGRRQKAMQRAWLYYDGYMPSQVRVKPGDYDDNVRLEYPRLIVDVGLSFLFGSKLTFTPENAADAPVIDDTWGDADARMTLLTRLGLNGAVTGHAYIKLVPDSLGGVRLVVLDSGNVDVNWEPEDFTKVQSYTVDWIAFDALINKEVCYQQNIQAQYDETGAIVNWLVTDSRSIGDSHYVVVNEEVWDYPFPPIVDCQNLPTANEYYGAPELSDTSLDVCDRINMAATNIQKILRYHAHPKVFIYGYSGGEIDLSVDTAVNFPSTDTSVGILGMPTDLGAAFNMMDRLTDTLLLLSRTPRAALGDPAMAAAAMSGLALKLGFMPLVDKTSTKRNLYGELLAEVNRRVLVLTGQTDPAPVVTNWPSITPDDPMADAQTALLQQQAGASKETTLATMGFDPQNELGKAQVENQAAMDAMQQSLASGSLLNQDTGSAQNSQAAMSSRSQKMTGQ